MRKSAYLKNDTCSIVNSSIKLHIHWNVFLTFTNPSVSGISNETKDFDHIPKKLLESFRILNFTTPEYIYIIRGFLVAFGVENYCGLAKKILMFFDLIRSCIGNKGFLLKENIEKKDLKKNQIGEILMRVNLGNIVKIVKKAGENVRRNERKIDDVWVENEIIKEIKGFFKRIISENHWIEVLSVLEAVFGKSKGKADEIFDKKNEDKRVLKENLKKFLEMNGIVESEKFSKYCKIFLEIIKNGNSLMICGKIGRSKSLLIRAAAYLFSAMNGIFIRN